MIEARLLLDMITKRIPPGEGQRHNITLNDEGLLEITLMLGDIYVPFRLEATDFDKPVSDLVDTIQEMMTRSPE